MFKLMQNEIDADVMDGAVSNHAWSVDRSCRLPGETCVSGIRSPFVL